MKISQSALNIPAVSLVSAALPKGYGLGTHMIGNSFSVFIGSEFVSSAWVEDGRVVFDFCDSAGGHELERLLRKEFSDRAELTDAPLVWAVLVPDGEEWTFFGEHPHRTSEEAIKTAFVAGRNPGPQAVLVSYRDKSWNLDDGLLSQSSWSIGRDGFLTIHGLCMRFQISKPIVLHMSRQ